MAKPPWLFHYPAGLSAEIEIPHESLCGMLERAVEKYGPRDALVFVLAPHVVKRWSYSELWAEILSFSSGLDRDGFRKGDRLALYLPNCPQYIIAYFAAQRIGLTVVQVTPLAIGDDLIFPIQDSGAKGIVTLDFLSHHLEILWEKLMEPKPKVIVGRLSEVAPFFPGHLFVNHALRKEGLDPSLPRHIPFLSFRMLSLPEKGNASPIEVSIDVENDVAVLQYTGGTMGRPRAVMLTNRNLVANALQIRAWDRGGRDGEEVVLAVIPFSHVYGMTVAMNFPLFFGTTLVVSPKKPGAGNVLPLLERYHPTQFPGVPALYRAINDHPRVSKVNLKGVRVCLSGSAPLTEEVATRFEELTRGHLIEGYGLSEASPVTHVNPIVGKRKTGSVGLPVPGTEMRIVSPQDPAREMGVNEVGELAVRGPQVMKGYWNDPFETESVLKGGWLLTGDLAKMDGEGYTYIVGRKKEIILVGGFNVYPGEVEDVLAQHPDLIEAAVVGVPTERLEEAVKAFVVPKPGTHLQERDVVEFVRSRIAHYKVPKFVEFVPRLPRSEIGKVLHRELKGERSLSSSER